MKPSSPGKIKLQLLLSHSGACSRRRALEFIQAGHVKVNGVEEREPSRQVDPGKDTILLAGEEIVLKRITYLMLNKPAGYVTTLEDRHADKTVMELLPEDYRHLKPVGRLDEDTEGLLLFTNDGEMAYRLTHPKFNINKTYFAEIQGGLTSEEKKRLERGLVIENHKTAPASVSDVKNAEGRTQLHIVIHEGRKRQIRLMFARISKPVLYLKRIRQGPLDIDDLKVGQWRLLTAQEIKLLKKI